MTRPSARVNLNRSLRAYGSGRLVSDRKHLGLSSTIGDSSGRMAAVGWLSFAQEDARDSARPSAAPNERAAGASHQANGIARHSLPVVGIERHLLLTFSQKQLA